jgi:hypothetical protein
LVAGHPRRASRTPARIEDFKRIIKVRRVACGSLRWTIIEGAPWPTSQSTDRDYGQYDEAAPLE